MSTEVPITGPSMIILIVDFSSDSSLLWEAISSSIFDILESTVSAEEMVQPKVLW